MTFFEVIENLVKNNENFDWDYYRCHTDCRTAEEVFANPNRFINETFLYAKKNLLVATAYDDRNRFDGPAISSARAAHSVSSFFIGFILAQGLFGDKADSFCQIHETKNGIFPFTYVWNLTCLYHDFGYEFENDNNCCERLKYEIVIPDFEKIDPYRPIKTKNHYRTLNTINKFFLSNSHISKQGYTADSTKKTLQKYSLFLTTYAESITDCFATADL